MTGVPKMKNQKILFKIKIITAMIKTVFKRNFKYS